MTTTALANNFTCCQSFLGAKIHDPKDPGADLSAMLYQVVGATFDLMDVYADVWTKSNSSEKIPTFGFSYDVGLEPVSVNIIRMLEKFRLGVRDLKDIWKVFLPKETIDFLLEARSFPKNKFHIPDEVWAEIIYSSALAAHKKELNKEHLLKSLTPLYIGKTASFIIETWESDASAVEEKIEKLCRVFEEKKSLLKEKWD